MKKRKRTSVVWDMPSEEFKDIVKNSNSIADIIRCFQFSAIQGNYKTIKRRIKEEDIDLSHIKLGLNSNKGRKFPSEKKLLKEIMIEGSTYNRCHLKKRLLDENILKNICAICGLLPEWNNKKLVMVLDHINGISDDNRKENLRLLCPNCNSQQSTFAGRNRIKRSKKYCNGCGKEIWKTSKLCVSCAVKKRNKNNVALKLVK